MNPTLHLGGTVYHALNDDVQGRYVDLGGHRFYRIHNVNGMRPFLMSVTSASERWMFLSSTGGLTAGTRNPDHALFPYVTDDKLHHASDHTGSHAILLVEREGKRYRWEPLSDRVSGVYRLERNLYKSSPGNRVVFEEINHDLGLTYRAAWSPTEALGFVLRFDLIVHGNKAVGVYVLQGMRNLLPAGTDPMMQASRSNLLDAYKKAELLPDSGLGLFTLSAIPVDRAEPSESLRATTVWYAGGDELATLLSERQVSAFRTGEAIETEVDVRAERGAYYVLVEKHLKPGDAWHGHLVAEQDQGPDQVAALHRLLLDKEDNQIRIDGAIGAETMSLNQITGSADGLQLVKDELLANRHYANVLYNVMRGGLPLFGYLISTPEFRQFMAVANAPLAKTHADWLASLPDFMPRAELISGAEAQNDVHLLRHAVAYLPFAFSRRHGDPSRPWNRFSINMRDEKGHFLLDYEGNWRDIFQNWEALAFAYPDYLPGMIARFLNASTADGYNPYRITRDDIDWEVSDPHDPWSYIGYWGDHQIIYLLKLLEAQEHHVPGSLAEALDESGYAYADVPYRIVSYKDIMRDPKDTVRYDDDCAAGVTSRMAVLGADGQLVPSPEGQVLLVGLAEKLLLPFLVKCGNLVPGGGIWLNTQRPEWNDANNALVGQGLSMVTVAYMRRYAIFVRQLFVAGPEAVQVSEEVASYLHALSKILADLAQKSALNPGERRSFVDALGAACEQHREAVYAGFSGKRDAISKEDVLTLLDHAAAVLEQSISENRGQDGLFHAYNRLQLDPEGGIRIAHFYPMLEGQVAVLSAGVMPAQEAVELLDALRQSDLYRKDQDSYLLYPDRELARYTEKNILPAAAVEASSYLRDAVAADDKTIVNRDVDGRLHFNPDFRNAADLKEALQKVAVPPKEIASILALWETVFDHASFTGRSGTFYGYEGLGSIYWHMVSKLLLAVQEVAIVALEADPEDPSARKLVDHYYAVRRGIGWEKTPANYGAFPSDPYSHTPGQRGAQQPGMTGQVKEDILCRFGELGIAVADGCLVFRPLLLRSSEFLTEAVVFHPIALDGSPMDVPLEAGQLAFTYCQVPVVYRLSAKPALHVHRADGSVVQEKGMRLDRDSSREIFGRTGRISKLVVDVVPGLPEA